MKTQKQVEEKLEKAVDALADLSNKMTDSPTEEERQTLVAAFVAVVAYGWVLDCEAEIRELFRNIKLAGVAGKLENI